MPRASRFFRSSEAMATASGVSPWTQMEAGFREMRFPVMVCTVPLGDHFDNAFADDFRIVKHRSGLPAAHQSALIGVGPVGEGFRCKGDTVGFCGHLRRRILPDP